MRKLKKRLISAPTLKKAVYTNGKPIIATIDTSPTGIGWAIGQDDDEVHRYAIRFGAKVLSMRQRNYPQIKRELWGIVTALKIDKEYFIGAYVIVETDCLPLIGMIASCSTPDIAMLRWIAYIKSLNPEFRHIAGKDNMVADMLSRARFEDEDQPNNEDIDKDLFTSYSISHMDSIAMSSHQLFIKEDYDHEFLMIGLYLSTMSKQPQWDQATFKRVRRKAYGFF